MLGPKKKKGCWYRVFVQEDPHKMKKRNNNKPVMQMRVDDPRGAEALVRYAKWK